MGKLCQIWSHFCCTTDAAICQVLGLQFKTYLQHFTFKICLLHFPNRAKSKLGPITRPPFPRSSQTRTRTNEATALKTSLEQFFRNSKNVFGFRLKQHPQKQTTATATRDHCYQTFFAYLIAMNMMNRF